MTELPRDLSGEIAVVTGGGTGIGKAIALALAAQGATVVVASRRTHHLAATVEEIESGGHAAWARATDVRQASECRQLVHDVVSRFGRLDVLINNAGGNKSFAFEAWTDDEIDNSLALNLRSFFVLSQEAAIAMSARKSGNIVNITSIAGTVAMPGLGPYGMAKAGVSKSDSDDGSPIRCRWNPGERRMYRVRQDGTACTEPWMQLEGIPMRLLAAPTHWAAPVRCVRLRNPSSSSCPRAQASSPVKRSTSREDLPSSDPGRTHLSTRSVQGVAQVPEVAPTNPAPATAAPAGSFLEPRRTLVGRTHSLSDVRPERCLKRGPLPPERSGAPTTAPPKEIRSEGSGFRPLGRSA